MDRRLIEYLPPVLHPIREFAAIMETEEADISALWDDVDAQFAEKYLDTATVTGISRWENIFGIVPHGTDTLDDRRFNIRMRLLDDGQVNYLVMKNKLITICGEGNVWIIYQPDNYIVSVLLALRTKKQKNQVLAVLEDMLPSNFLVRVELRYITHELLSVKTHGQLADYTHTELREDASLKEELGG